jgi:hypothetical protein
MRLRALPLLLAITACEGEGFKRNKTDAETQDRPIESAGDDHGSESDASDVVAADGGTEDADAAVDAPADVPEDAPADAPPIDAGPMVVNLAGNPGVELPAGGSVAAGGDFNWFPFNPGAATFARSTAQAHSGTASALLSGRQSVQGGVGYVLPAGAGTYRISLWVLHTDATSHFLGLTWRRCSTTDFVGIASAPAPIPPNTWTPLSAVITVPDNCVHSTAYSEQSEPMPMDGSIGVVADLYADDIAIEPMNVPNIVGNGGGEVAIAASGTSPWKGYGCTIVQSTTVFHAGVGSVSCTDRAVAASGPAYYLPAGAARYNVSAFAQHAGTGMLDLALTATLTCSTTATGAPSTTTLTVASAAGVMPSTWKPLTGTLTIPAFCTTAFLRLEQQGGAELPVLFIDELSAAFAP